MALQPSKSSSRLHESLLFMFLQCWLSTGPFGSTWSVLGASWAQLGVSWAPLGLNLGSLGRLLGSTWALLGASWAQLGRSWALLGLNLGVLGGFWTSLGLTWPPSGLQMAIPGRFWALRGSILGPPRVLRWSILVPCQRTRPTTSTDLRDSLTRLPHSSDCIGCLCLPCWLRFLCFLC